MLSISNVGGGSEAAGYYERADDYYTKGQSPSKWMGQTAEYLGLKAQVEIADFKKLLDGFLPQGHSIKVSPDGRRGGTDLTFSAPKSISLQALVGGDHRLIEAHERAVEKALEYAETLVSFRQTHEGETKKFRSGNFAAATFRHELSRACDPQLHTHCVILNLTRRPDGNWRAMDNELLYRQKMLMGALYRTELAREVQMLGYQVRVPHSDGRFELAHISDSQLEAFSQRSQAIEKALAANGKTRETASPQEKQIIAIATRQKKTDVDRKTLAEYWKEKSWQAEIQYKLSLNENINNLSNFNEVLLTINFALDHGLERQSVVTEAAILREALQQGVGKIVRADIEKEVARRVKEGLLIQSGDRFTTPKAMELEKRTLSVERKGRGKSLALLSPDEAVQGLAGKGLNEGQFQAATLLLTTPNQVVGVQGFAGTGKTFMLSSARELGEAKGYKFIGLAPSTGAARELAKSGIQSGTIAMFEAAKDKGLNAQTVLIVDEAGMVSSKQMEMILRLARRAQAKVLLVGDTQQLKAVEAGNPFAQLQAHGMATAGMGEIQRQRNPELKMAVELAARGSVRESVATIRNSVVELKDSGARHEQIAKDYSELPEEDRKGTIIVSGTNRARRAINQRVRENLGLSGKGHKVTILEKKDLTRPQRKDLRNYWPGDVIESEKAYRSLGLKKGETAQIKAIRRSYLVLEKADGSTINWNPKNNSKVSIYQTRISEFASGDIVRITKNDSTLGLANGDRGKIIEMDSRKVLRFQREDGKTFHLDPKHPLHMDHGYCSTVHAAQGKTCERVLVDTDTRSLTTAKDHYYVAISRARSEVKIYTNDAEQLPDALSRENVKEIALDIKGRSPAPSPSQKPPLHAPPERQQGLEHSK